MMSRRSVIQGFAVLAAAASRAAQSKGAQSISVEAGSSRIAVDFNASDFNLPPAAIEEWVSQCAQAVSKYLGKFPVSRARLQVEAGGRGHGVQNGVSWGGREALCRITMGKGVTAAELKRDWVLTHEMFHFAFPSVPEQHRWIEEGISTYAEPIARAGVGLLSPEEVWRDMVRDLPQGVPEAGDEGLDYTHTWGRTYWGGALFCLVADVGIRKATENRKGLRDALKGINAAGGNINAEWPLTRALEIGDRATGATVLSSLYRSMGSSATPVDLPALWKQLGVIRTGNRITFDGGAPLAATRAGIV